MSERKGNGPFDGFWGFVLGAWLWALTLGLMLRGCKERALAERVTALESNTHSEEPHEHR